MTFMPIILFLIPAVAILAASYLKLQFSRFMGVYIFFAAAAAFLQWYTYDLTAMLIALAVAAGGALVGLSIIGFFGEKFRQSSYKNIMVMLGLFPWFISPTATIIYGSVVVGAFVFAFLLDYFRKNNFRTKKESKPRLIISMPVFLTILICLLFI